VERQRNGGAVAVGEDWPREVQEVLGKIEAFVDATLHQPRPVAQGAVEVGDLVVLFRVVPKNVPAAEAVEEKVQKARSPGRPGRSRRRKA